MNLRFAPALMGLSAVLAIGAVAWASAQSLPDPAGAADRFGGPLHAADIFPSTLEPYHPLNPADLARNQESILEFGVRPDGRSLILGLPSFLLSISDQEMAVRGAKDPAQRWNVLKYELGYGISSADLGWSRPGRPSAALGFHLRYLDFRDAAGMAPRAEWAYPDLGGSLWFGRLRADAAVLNLLALSEPADGDLPGRQPREFSFGLGYGLAGDWLMTGRFGVQDSTRRQNIIDLGFEKRFFRSVTFRVGNQRRYAAGDGVAAREIRSSLAGGIWYRLIGVGRGYRYPERDLDLLSTGTLLRILHDVQVGGAVVLTRVPEAEGRPGEDDTSLLLTVGKAF